MGRNRQSKNERRRRFEQFEQRLVMSAQGIGAEPPDLNQLVEEIAPLVTDISTDAGLTTAGNNSAFDGSGQTIAIIDSGIAFDHAAFGGGFGYGNKVVGGWDFAENDANPYDDGPAGFHGTHVAGIAAGNGGGYQGVAPGADLVGLRVFDDSGIGKIEWVESALQWVRNNLDSFANPITTVNLSLGADLSTESASDWAVLSDEFAALKDEGVFISVAAGNDFTDFNSQVLSYPAADENVVAVASHDANNQLSDFSQRADGVLVAPGESIRSAVPNHLFGTRRVDQLLGASGTSQAAPYVAGASAVLRQAYAAMGHGEVDQDILYETFLRTSNQIYDSITNTTYQQLDLDAAIASITENVNANAGVTRVGTITGGELIRGTISETNQADTFQFTAGESGQVELTFEANGELDPTLEIRTLSGQNVDLEFNNERVYLNVVAGETYRLEVGSDSGGGHYQISTAFQQASSATDLGVVDSIEVTDFIAGERTYSLTASSSGPAAFGFATDSAEGTIEVYDSNMNRLTSQQIENGRVDFQFEVTQGESLFVLLQADGNVELSVDNLVSVDDGTLTVNGTDAADSFVISDDSTLRVEVNGTRYNFQHNEISAIVIQGDATMDSLQLELSDRYERTVLRQNRVDAFDGAKSLRAIGFQTIDVVGSGQLTVAGTEQTNDTIVASYDSASIAAGRSTATAHGFNKVIADGKGGHDRVEFQGDDGDDIVHSRNDYSVISNGESRLIAIDYDEVSFDTQGGYDVANILGSTTDDQITLGDTLVKATNDRTTFTATGLERANAFAGERGDAVIFTDSDGNDQFLFADGTTQLVTDSSHHIAHNFANIVATSTAGYDVAQIDATRENDSLVGSRDRTTLNTGIASVELNLFDRVNVVANFTGYDNAELIGTSGDDQFIVDSESAAAIFEGGSIIRTVGFGDVSFDGGGGFDVSFYEGSAGVESLDVNNDRTIFRTDNIKTVARETQATRFDGQGGGDSVFLDDATSLDVLASLGDSAVAVLEHHQTVEASGFNFLEVQAVDGVIATYDMERVDFESVLRGQWESR